MSHLSLTDSYVNKVEGFFIPSSLDFSVWRSHDCTHGFVVPQTPHCQLHSSRVCAVTWSHWCLHRQFIIQSDECCSVHARIMKAHEGQAVICGDTYVSHEISELQLKLKSTLGGHMGTVR